MARGSNVRDIFWLAQCAQPWCLTVFAHAHGLTMRIRFYDVLVALGLNGACDLRAAL